MPTARPLDWEQRFARTFADPVGFYEWLYGYDCPDYLAEILRCRDPQIEWSAAPACLKTTAIVVTAIHNCLMRPFATGRLHKELILAPLESHLSVPWNEAVERINNNALLTALLRDMPGRQMAIQRDPTWRIHWYNGSNIEFRISGADGKPFYGRHVDGLQIDEAEAFPMGAAAVLETRRNPGCQLRVYGMVDGVRDTYLFHAHKDPTFRHFLTKRYDSPLWSEDEGIRLERIWGRHSPEWQWYVEARWDVAAEAPFDMNAITECVRLGEAYRPVEITVDEFRGAFNSEPEAAFGGLPTFPGQRVLIASDIGETQSPTNIGIVTLDQTGPGGVACDRLEFRIALHQLEAYERSKCFDYLARLYRAVGIAIDQGAAGSAVISNLLNPELFPGRNYEGVMMPVDFRRNVEMARIEAEFDPTPQDLKPFGKEKPPKPEMIEQPIKHATTKWLRERFFRRGLSLPNDTEMLDDEFRIHRLVGNRYTDPQHTIDMLRCYAYGRHVLDQTGIAHETPAYVEAPLIEPMWVGDVVSVG